MERNVSLCSGNRICRALRNRGHQAVLVDMFFGLENYAGRVEDIFETADGLCRDFTISQEEPDLEQIISQRRDKSANLFGKDVLRVCQMADIVFLALHGTCGEDGRVQAAFDLMGIPYTGAGYLGSAIAMDKDLTKRLIAHEVKTAPWFTVLEMEEAERAAGELGYPCVVKPMASGSSIGVSIVREQSELHAAMEKALEQGGIVLLEKYIAGREIQVGLLADRALPSIEIVPKEGFYDYANKYQPGAAEEICPAPIPSAWENRLRAAAENVYSILGLSVYARVDFIVTEDGTPWFLEINTLPGMTPTSLVPQEAAAVGIDYEELCEKIVEESLAVRGMGEEA